MTEADVANHEQRQQMSDRKVYLMLVPKQMGGMKGSIGR